jgi:hypothetical protein
MFLLLGFNWQRVQDAFNAARSTVTHAFESMVEDSSPRPASPAAGSCPSRVAGQLTEGGVANLVAAYRTEYHRIILCKSSSGQVFYYGEKIDRPETGMVLPARSTVDGYVAQNSVPAGIYEYVLDSANVTIYLGGEQIGQERLTPETAPS